MRSILILIFLITATTVFAQPPALWPGSNVTAPPACPETLLCEVLNLSVDYYSPMSGCNPPPMIRYQADVSIRGVNIYNYWAVASFTKPLGMGIETTVYYGPPVPEPCGCCHKQFVTIRWTAAHWNSASVIDDIHKIMQGVPIPEWPISPEWPENWETMVRPPQIDFCRRPEPPLGAPIDVFHQVTVTFPMYPPWPPE